MPVLKCQHEVDSSAVNTQRSTFLGARLALGGAAVGQHAVSLTVSGGHADAVLREQHPARLGLAALHLHALMTPKTETTSDIAMHVSHAFGTTAVLGKC